MITGFAPVVPDSAQLLVLGSMPGLRSLSEQRYYAHPQNQFWPLMTAVLNRSDSPRDYAQRLEMLASARVALWDVLAHCERQGSLDSAIKSEVPNDIATLIARNPGIRAIALNGRKAESSFGKHFGQMPDIAIIGLPSSSAANARMRFEQKAALWSQKLQPWI